MSVWYNVRAIALSYKSVFNTFLHKSQKNLMQRGQGGEVFAVLQEIALVPQSGALTN